MSKDKPLFKVQYSHQKRGLIQFYCWELDLYGIPMIHATKICQSVEHISKYTHEGHSVQFHNLNGVSKVSFPYFNLIVAEELYPMPNNNLKPIINPTGDEQLESTRI